MDLMEVSNNPSFFPRDASDASDESTYYFDLPNLNELSGLNVAFHAMRFFLKPFVKLLAIAPNARSHSDCLRSRGF